MTRGDDRSLTAVPMQPLKHLLVTHWYIAPLKLKDGQQPPAPRVGMQPALGGSRETPDGSFRRAGPRARGDRSMYKKRPPGDRYRWKTFRKPSGKGKQRLPARSVLPLSKLRPGTYRITCQVADTTRWVLRDEKHLLKERVEWIVTVKPKPKPKKD